MTDEQEMELHEELKWAKIEAGQAHAMVAALQEKVERQRKALEFIASPDGNCYNCASIALAALEGK